MQVTITKMRADDRILIERDGHASVAFDFPKKGSVPHDAVHEIVERTMRLRRGFWGIIAEGVHPDDVLAMAKAAGHASARRAQVPQSHIVELLQAERLVECFEAALWDGGVEADDLRQIARVACESSHVPLPPLDDPTIGAIMEEVRALDAAWRSAALGHSISFAWPHS